MIRARHKHGRYTRQWGHNQRLSKANKTIKNPVDRTDVQ